MGGEEGRNMAGSDLYDLIPSLFFILVARDSCD